MTIKNYVVIPFRDEPELTTRLVRELLEQDEVDELLLYDNGSSSVRFLDSFVKEDHRVRIFSRPRSSIYQMWNEGWKRAVEETHGQPVNVAILNNDISIPSKFLSTLARWLRSSDTPWCVYPDYNLALWQSGAQRAVRTVGTYKDGGMCGWAFMLKGETVHEGMPYVDEGFEWWFGDDDIVRNIYQLGHEVWRIQGLPLDHHGEATASNGLNEWTHAAKERDVRRAAELWQ